MMVELPKDIVTAEHINHWWHLQTQLSKLKAEEMLLRKRIFGGLFSVQEGTEYVPLANGYKLQAVAKLDRAIDIAHFDSMREVFKLNNINPDSLVKFAPELIISSYRKLTEEQRQLVDQTLVIKPSAPSLKIIEPKID